MINLEKNSTLPEIQFLNFVITDTKKNQIKITKCTLKKTKLSISAIELLSSTIYISDSFLTS